MKRINDVEQLGTKVVTLYIDDEPVTAAYGETVLTTLFAVGQRAISRNDYGFVFSAYCGMGVCHSCTVKIDDIEKQRACQILVRDGMKVFTCSNLHHNDGQTKVKLHHV